MSTRRHPLVITDAPPTEVDLSSGYDLNQLRSARWAIGGYLERRTSQMYDSHIYADDRTVHMGIDIWGPAGTPVYAFADGKVWGQANNDNPRDYGPTIITIHQVDGVHLWVLHGHLSRASLNRHQQGDVIHAGDIIGTFGSESENGGWLPHLHCQIACAMPEQVDMPGVVRPDAVEHARAIYPDPASIIDPLWRTASTADY